MMVEGVQLKSRTYKPAHIMQTNNLYYTGLFKRTALRRADVFPAYQPKMPPILQRSILLSLASEKSNTFSITVWTLSSHLLFSNRCTQPQNIKAKSPLPTNNAVAHSSLSQKATNLWSQTACQVHNNKSMLAYFTFKNKLALCGNISIVNRMSQSGASQ